jgi:tRNA A-37 threonylcarbamoyl transferase component Bud32/tetratricopeptide (TPR) repeat protein
MSTLLPGSSDPSPNELLRIQEQCDRVRAEQGFLSVDAPDEMNCLALLEGIPYSVEFDPTTSIEGSDLDFLNDRTPNPSTRFTDLRCIGKGAFGLVYSAREQGPERKKVAIKILRPSKAADQIAMERFLDEMKVMSGLHHPNIITVFSMGEFDRIPYMVTELADLGSVASKLRDATLRPSPRQAAWLIGKVADAVQEAHSTTILHRDIKPGNILLRAERPELSEGLGLWPLLTDFGLSKNFSVEPANPLTIHGQVLGTLAYMSPEQVKGGTLKVQSDIFSLGVVLHELLYGQHPFLATSDFETRSNIVHVRTVKSGIQGRDIPSSLQAIVSKCLQKEPSDRYQHASDLATDLNHFLTGEPISVSPPTAWQSFVRWASLHPIASTFLGTILFCMAASILLLSREWGIQRELTIATQSVADDRAQISHLFLESMRATNSGINDTILAGKKVSPISLIATLERQIPLLEKARTLDPDDDLLARQLEIMYHYQSLCCFSSMNAPNNPLVETDRGKAIESRKKSLELIDLLSHRNPLDEKLQIARVNGEYFLSLLHDPKGNYDLRIEQNLRALQSAEAFLQQHAENRYVQETANKIRFDRAVVIGDFDREECLQLCQTVKASSLDLFLSDETRTSNLIYLIEALSYRGQLWSLLGRHREADAEYEELESLIASKQKIFYGDWGVIDATVNLYAYRCLSLINCGRYADVIVLTGGWQKYVERLGELQHSVVYGNYFDGREVSELLPLYFRFLASERKASKSTDSPKSVQLARLVKIKQSLQMAFNRCRANSEVDVPLLLSILDDMQLPTELFQEWMEAE